MNIVITPEELENIIESYVVSKFSMEVTGIGLPKKDKSNGWVAASYAADASARSRVA